MLILDVMFQVGPFLFSHFHCIQCYMTWLYILSGKMHCVHSLSISDL
uniref:Uncharacterized protein n=1 Tax=Rhizophora mucronata TaxID=61149 RepID=A0A2P2JF87_RHIMU